MLSCFPHLTDLEFEAGCSDLLEKFRRRIHTQNEWISVEIIDQYEIRQLRITKALSTAGRAPTSDENETELDDLEDDDEEALQQACKIGPVVNYDIILSPTYRVPVLYISIADSQHRFPPTMATLYEHLIPPTFKAQIEAVGVIGGITITDHAVTNRPVFFIHLCQTAAVMEASVGERNVTADEYLTIWIGALGKCAGLEVPLAIMCEDGEMQAPAHSRDKARSTRED